jgi:hypothetical protein
MTLRLTLTVATAGLAITIAEHASAQPVPVPLQPAQPAPTQAPPPAPAPAPAAPAAAPAATPAGPHEETNEEWAARQNKRERGESDGDHEHEHRKTGGSGFHGAMQVVGSRRSLMGIGLWGYGGGGAIGGDVLENLGVYFDTDFEIGETAHDLSTFYVRSGIRLEFILDRFRMGAGGQLQYFAISRITRNETIDSFGVGIFAIASFDLIEAGRGKGLYVGLRLNADAFAHAYIMGAQVPIGFRF